MFFIDTHCHVSDKAFASEEDAYIQRAKAAGVGLMLQPDIDSSERGPMLELVRKHPSELRAMLGLYPGSVDKDWRAEIDAMTATAKEWEEEGRHFVAIGEIGLDYHEGKEFMAEQKDALAWQLEYAARHDLPVNIHLRDAIGDFIDVMKAHSHLGLRGNMHAYSGSYESFMELSKTGDWFVGVGGVLTFKNAAYLPEVVRRLPLGRLLLETDSPYLTPVPYRGKRNESAYIPLIAARIAEIKGRDVEEVAEATTNNAKELFKLTWS